MLLTNHENPKTPKPTKLPLSMIYRRIAANNNEYAINPLATFTPFAELGAFVCEALGAALVCDPDDDGGALFPVLSVVCVVAEAEVDTTVEAEVDTAADILDVEATDELEVDAAPAAPVGVASPLAPSVKPQVGAAGPVTLDQTSITHSTAIFWSTHVVPVSVGARSRM
jgi:hypothetical protein